MAQMDYIGFITNELLTARETIVRQMDTYHRNASGKAVKSLRVQQDGDGATLYGAEYFKYMEQGRKGGRVPKDFASVIYTWSLAKGINVTPMPYRRGKGKYSPEERARWQFARCVAHRIQAEGTRLYRTHEKQDIYTTALIKAVNDAMQKVVVRVSSDLGNITQNL